MSGQGPESWSCFPGIPVLDTPPLGEAASARQSRGADRGEGRPFGQIGIITAVCLERISFERTVRAKTLDARLRGHGSQEIIPAKAGIQEPYIQLQTALGAGKHHKHEYLWGCSALVHKTLPACNTLPPQEIS